MKKHFLFVGLFLGMLVLVLSCQQQKEEGQWIELFNGEDLTGWTPKITGYEAGENFGNTFRVEEGLLKVRYDAYDTFDGRFGHLFYKDQFSHYKLRVEYRFVGDQCEGGEGWAYRNSGIMIHGQTPESMDLDQDFPTSIEVQLLGSDSLVERTNMNVCTPGTHVVMDGVLIEEHCNNSSSGFFYDDRWVTAEIEVRGNEVIYHVLAGDTVLQYNKPQLDEREASFDRLVALNNGDKMLHGGTISLQSESHPIDFRKVELMVLE